MEEKYERVLKSLNSSIEELSPEKMAKFKKSMKNIPNPENMTSEQALNIIQSCGLDLKTIKKSIHGSREIKNNKIPRNSKCPCNSGEKYKKCCLNKG